MPKISVIMPVYQVELYLENAIMSVLCQTFSDYELILVDDGSPDKCPSICDCYASENPCIRVIHKENGGLSSARNAGIRAAKGEYLYMIDSDDTILPTTLERAWVSATKFESDIVIVGIRAVNVSGGKTVSVHDRVRPDLVIEREDIGRMLPRLMSESMFNYAWDKLYRRTTIVENSVWYDSFFDRVCEDTIFLCDLLPYVRCISTVPEICYQYMIRDNHSVVKKYLPERFEKYVARLNRLSEVGKHYPEQAKAFDEIISREYCNSVIWSIANLFHKDCGISFREIRSFYQWMKGLDSFGKDYADKARQHLQTADVSRRDVLLYTLYEKNLLLAAALATSLLKKRNNRKQEGFR